MKTYLIDSDVLIDFFKRRDEAVVLVEELGKIGDIAISALSVAELWSGWTEKDAAIYLPQLYNIALVIPVSDEIAEQAGAYRETYKRKGIVLPTIDALIAATAILYSYCLVTRNRKDYPLPELDLYPASE